jgi:hypothetical protein
MATTKLGRDPRDVWRVAFDKEKAPVQFSVASDEDVIEDTMYTLMDWIKKHSDLLDGQ